MHLGYFTWRALGAIAIRRVCRRGIRWGRVCRRGIRTRGIRTRGIRTRGIRARGIRARGIRHTRIRHWRVTTAHLTGSTSRRTAAPWLTADQAALTVVFFLARISLATATTDRQADETDDADNQDEMKGLSKPMSDQMHVDTPGTEGPSKNAAEHSGP